MFDDGDHVVHLLVLVHRLHPVHAAPHARLVRPIAGIQLRLTPSHHRHLHAQGHDELLQQRALEHALVPLAVAQLQRVNLLRLQAQQPLCLVIEQAHVPRLRVVHHLHVQHVAVRRRGERLAAALAEPLPVLVLRHLLLTLAPVRPGGTTTHCTTSLPLRTCRVEHGSFVRDRAHHHLHRDVVRLLLVPQLFLLRLTPPHRAHRDAAQRLALQRVGARRRDRRAETHHRLPRAARRVPLPQHRRLGHVRVQLEGRAVEPAQGVAPKITDRRRLDVMQQ